MELQFEKTSIPCLQQLIRQVQYQEQTQEVKLTEEMPDIGRVLGAWGQVMLRGKEWRGDSMNVSCGCMVWVMYAPEDGSPAQSMETWIPFNLKWDVPETDRDGIFSAQCFLRSVDARATAGRKLMVRASVGVMAEAYGMQEMKLPEPMELPEDIQVKKQTYPVCLAREAGEKPFMVDEDLVLPQSSPPMEKWIRCAVDPVIQEGKVMTDKVVFRGEACVHILYRGADGGLYTWDCSIPFSQYGELEKEYSQEATAMLVPMLTNLELDRQEDRLHLKAGATCQYVVYDRQMMELVQDAYSLRRPVLPQQDALLLPSVLDSTEQTVNTQGIFQQGAKRIVDVAFYPDQPVKRRQGEDTAVELTGAFELLYYDEEDSLQADSVRWEETVPLKAAEDTETAVSLFVTQAPQAVMTGDSVLARGAVELCTVTTAAEQMILVTALTVGEEQPPDPNRPSLILRRAGNEELWDIAKACGSTVEAISQANGLSSQPEGDQMLLIPIP